MITILGARTHNLQNINLSLPQGKLILLTGVSGAGKSSLALDTLANEGIHRFLEGAYPQMRALFSKQTRPNVEAIHNLPPTVAIACQHSKSSSATVASLTGCDLLLERLFAYASIQHSPLSGKPLHRYSLKEMVEEIEKGTGRLYLLAPLETVAELEGLAKMGYTRALVDQKEWDLSEEIPKKGEEFLLVIDRVKLGGIHSRLLESCALALKIGQGVIKTWDMAKTFSTYSTLYLDGNTQYAPLTPSQVRERSKQALACKIDGQNLPELEASAVDELYYRKWPPLLELVAGLKERLKTLKDLGLGYLSLDRLSKTLSAGELQRVLLAAQVASGLTGLLLILDEPTRGLHRKDVEPLITLLNQLKDQGNTLLVVEHEPHLIAHADHIVELDKGEVVFEGAYSALLKGNTLTGRYLSGKEPLPKREGGGKASTFVEVKGASLRNLHNLSLSIPKKQLVAFAGVSGSGKSTLLFDYLKPRLEGEFDRVIAVDEHPLGLSSRSLPLTAIGLMTPLRNLLAQTSLAKVRGYQAAHFSLAKAGGRCETCQGKGVIPLDMGPLPGKEAVCAVCEGARYHTEALQITWKGHSPADILNLTANEAFALFSEIPQMADRLVLMTQLGLDYLKLGQPLNTLSSGELQRLKLIGQLAKPAYGQTLYMLDEPSSGLHLHDLAKLMEICHQLIAGGHTIWMIEHHLSMIRCADWVIELGPGAGSKGGRVIFEGTPEALKKAKTPTGYMFTGVALP